uniref:SPOR domain-containing protein n=1 Tax=Desulfobacca acetoxidans TaxID=60893 RepID=A0A7C5AL32_9BACT
MSTASAPNALQAGAVVARRYVILRPLREEPCGWVWLAQDRLIGIDLGFKFVPRHWERFAEAREVLRREAAMAHKLRHPLILQVFYYGEEEEGSFLLEEPFRGESLLMHLARLERFRLPQALTILEQTAQALEAAHRHHEVHQSLDPSQVLIAEGTVKLANFACSLRPEDDQVSHLELKAYIAPEVLQGEAVTPAANIFSLGVLGFRLLAGGLPYPLTFDEPFPYRLDQMPVDLEEIPLPLQNLLLQCLAPDPGDRFEDARAFLTALEQRRESWRTPPKTRWFGLPPERGREVAEGGDTKTSALITRLREKSKEALGRVRGTWQHLKDHPPSPGRRRHWFLGLVVALAVLGVFWWGGRTLLRKTEAPPPPTSFAPEEMKLPPAGGPPVSGVTEPTPPAATAEPPSTLSPAPSPAPQSPAVTPKEERYLLLVATYGQMEPAQALKKRLQAKKVPAQIAKVTSDKKKVYYLVKAGPYQGKKQAEEAAQRLKNEEHLAHTPKLVKIPAKTSNSESRRPSR